MIRVGVTDDDKVENKMEDNQKVEIKNEIKTEEKVEETTAVINDKNTNIENQSDGSVEGCEQVQGDKETIEETHESVTTTEEQRQQDTVESPLLSDPVVHTGIAIFSAIVFLLIRKLQHIVDDMRTLESMYNAKFES